MLVSLERYEYDYEDLQMYKWNQIVKHFKKNPTLLPRDNFTRKMQYLACMKVFLNFSVKFVYQPYRLILKFTSSIWKILQLCDKIIKKIGSTFCSPRTCNTLYELEGMAVRLTVVRNGPLDIWRGEGWATWFVLFAL